MKKNDSSTGTTPQRALQTHRYLELELELECMHAHGGIAIQQTSA